MVYVLEHDPDTGEWIASVDGDVVAVDSSALVVATALGAELVADAADDPGFAGTGPGYVPTVTP